MTANRRTKVLGAGVAALAAVGASAAFSAPAFAAETGKSAVSAPSPANLSRETIYFNGKAFDLHLAKPFQPVFKPGSPHVKLSGGATFLNGGFRLGGGHGTLDILKGNLTENLNGTLIYNGSAGSHPFTIKVRQFKFEVKNFVSAELAGDISVTGLTPHPISENGLDLLDLQLDKGSFSFAGHSIEARDVPGVIGSQTAQLTSGLLPPGTVIADTQFFIPVP